MNYPLCDRTVTLYRKVADTVSRKVITGCFYSWQLQQTQTPQGIRQQTKCLLIVPGEGIYLQPGDRVFDGVGPEQVDWQSFLPVTVPGLGELQYVKPYYLDGRLCHTEAGNK